MAGGRRRRVPDIRLPVLTDGDWGNVHTVLALDLATVDSGAAVFADRALMQRVPLDEGHAYTIPVAHHTPASWSLARRLAAIEIWVDELLDYLPIDAVVMESHPFAQGMRHRQETVEGLAMARAAAMIPAAQRGIPCAAFSVNDARYLVCSLPAPQETTGGDAVKAKVVYNMQVLGYEVPEKKRGVPNDNVADAMCLGEAIARLLALHHLQTAYGDRPGNGNNPPMTAQPGERPRGRRLTCTVQRSSPEEAHG